MLHHVSIINLVRLAGFEPALTWGRNPSLYSRLSYRRIIKLSAHISYTSSIHSLYATSIVYHTYIAHTSHYHLSLHYQMADHYLNHIHQFRKYKVLSYCIIITIIKITYMTIYFMIIFVISYKIFLPKPDSLITYSTNLLHKIPWSFRGESNSLIKGLQPIAFPLSYRSPYFGAKGWISTNFSLVISTSVLKTKSLALISYTIRGIKLCGGQDGGRTRNLCLARALLSRLSYSPTK